MRLWRAVAERLASALGAVTVAVGSARRANHRGACARILLHDCGWLLGDDTGIGTPFTRLTRATCTVRLRLGGVAPSLARLELQVARRVWCASRLHICIAQ